MVFIVFSGCATLEFERRNSWQWPLLHRLSSAIRLPLQTKWSRHMAFKVQVGPAQIAIHQGQTVLVTEPDGQVNWPSKRGLYFRDTRVISAWAIYANGEPWDLLNGGAICPSRGAHFPDQPCLRERGRADRGAHAGPGDRPPYRWRAARGHRHHQQQPEPGALQSGDRDPRRFRRHLRGQERSNRAARPHHHVVVGTSGRRCASPIATRISAAR